MGHRQAAHRLTNMGKSGKKSENTRLNKYVRQNKYGRGAAKKEARAEHHKARSATRRSLQRDGEDVCVGKATQTRKRWAEGTGPLNPNTLLETRATVRHPQHPHSTADA